MATTKQPPPTTPTTALLEDREKLRQRYLLSLLLEPPRSKTRTRR
ncbi:MAG: hypothetical protein ABI321_20635 [Polyangia bacterium]